MPETKPAEDFGGRFEEVHDGQYHFVILESLINPPTKSGVLDGFHIVLQVLDGTTRSNGVCTEVGRTMKARFPFPSEMHKDKGNFCNQKITNLLIAAGIMKEEERKAASIKYVLGHEIDDGGPEGRDDLRGKQIVATVKTEPSKTTAEDGTEREYLNPDIDGVHIYHVHNPHVAHVPKKQDFAKLVPVPTAYQQQPAAAAVGANGANGSTPAKQPQQSAQPQPEPAGAAVTADVGADDDLDLSDL